MKRPAGSSFRQADRYVGIGFQVAMSMVVYVLIGNWLDKRLGTDPWLTLAGVVLGFASMMFLVVRFASTASGKRKADSRQDVEAGGGEKAAE